MLFRPWFMGVAQCVARLTRNVEVVGSSPIKGPHCFLEQETLRYCLVMVGSRNDSSLISQSD